MKKWLFAIFFGSALVLGACGGGDDEATDDAGDTSGDTVETAAAEEVYKKSCAACHGGDLTGASGPDLNAVGAKYSADDIEGIIENGQGGMPAQPNVSDDDRALLAGWLADKK